MIRSSYLLLSVWLLLLTGCSGGHKSPASPTGEKAESRLQLSGAFALYPLAVRWAEAFQKQHPGVVIDISGGGAGKGMTDVLTGMVDIGMVSRAVYPEEIRKGAVAVAVVKDAVLPTVNTRNPEIRQIMRRGLSRRKALELWSGKAETWGQVLNTSSRLPVHVFTRSDACGAAETFSAWFGMRQEGLRGTAVFGDPGVASAIQKDKVGIGYNNIAYVYDLYTGKPYEDLAVIPIDINDNGRIDADENFYATSATLAAAVKAGKYPSPPARDLYMVIKGKPRSAVLAKFLHYILTDGQKLAGETGYVALSPARLRQELLKIKSE